MNATKALAISIAGPAALALAVLITLDEPPGAQDLPPAIRIDEARRMPLPRTEGGRILRDLSRQTFRFPWPLVEDKATITCRPGGIATVITSSGEYGLSGRAIGAGYPSIWDSVLPIELRRDAALAPLVQAALALCADTEEGQTSREMGQRHGPGNRKTSLGNQLASGPEVNDRKRPVRQHGLPGVARSPQRS